MKLEPIIQSEVRQKENHQYSKITHIYGIQKDGKDNSVCETAQETQMHIHGQRSLPGYSLKESDMTKATYHHAHEFQLVEKSISYDLCQK